MMGGLGLLLCSRRAAAAKLAAMVFSVGGPLDPPPLRLPPPAGSGGGKGWFNDSVAIARLLVQRQVGSLKPKFVQNRIEQWLMKAGNSMG